MSKHLNASWKPSKGFDKKVIAYAESGGITDLQDAISDYFKQYGMDYGRKDIIVTNGGSEALNYDIHVHPQSGR